MAETIPSGPSAGLRYIDTVLALLEQVREREMERIREAAELVAAAVGSGGLLHVFGSGHSHLLAEELFYRAGGFAAVNPILEDGLMLHRSARLSTELERLEGLASALLNRQPIKLGDAMLIASNSGRNAVAVEMAMEARKRGLAVIAVVSRKHAEASASRHRSGKRLHEVSDVVIDNGGAVGDAAVDIAGLPVRAAATSTAIGAAIVQAIMAEAAERLASRGQPPDLFASSNADGGDERNRAVAARYEGAIRCL